MSYLKKQIQSQINFNWQAILSTTVLISVLFFLAGAVWLVVSNFFITTENYFNKRYYSFLLAKESSLPEIKQLVGDLENLNLSDPVIFSNRDLLLENFFKSIGGQTGVVDTEIIEFAGAVDFSVPYQQTEKIKRIELLAKNPIVSEVISNNTLTGEMLKFLKLTKNLSLGFIAVITFIAITSIYILVQLLVYASSGDIKILRSLGGSYFLVLKPFLVTALLISALGYAIALSLNAGLFYISLNFLAKSDLQNYLPEKPVFFDQNTINISLGISLVCSMLGSMMAGLRVLKNIDKI